MDYLYYRLELTAHLSHGSKVASSKPRLRPGKNKTTNLILLLYLLIQDAVPCQVPNLVHGLNRLEPKVPIPDATSTRRRQEGQQTERQGEAMCFF